MTDRSGCMETCGYCGADYDYFTPDTSGWFAECPRCKAILDEHPGTRSFALYHYSALATLAAAAVFGASWVTCALILANLIAAWVRLARNDRIISEAGQ